VRSIVPQKVEPIAHVPKLARFGLRAWVSLRQWQASAIVQEHRFSVAVPAVPPLALAVQRQALTRRLKDGTGCGRNLASATDMLLACGLRGADQWRCRHASDQMAT
jgi:hypothetical protein